MSQSPGNTLPDRALRVYIAASFKHVHGVRLLGQALRATGFVVLDWTEMATPPPGLTPAQRRVWMDTDQAGGQVFSFCCDACKNSDLLIYFGESGQDAGVEVGMACGAGLPILGIRGPLEAPGLMLHGAVTTWAESIEDALDILRTCAALTHAPAPPEPDGPELWATQAHALTRRWRERMRV